MPTDGCCLDNCICEIYLILPVELFLILFIEGFDDFCQNDSVSLDVIRLFLCGVLVIQFLQQTFDGLFICLHQRDKRQNQRKDRFLQFSVSLHQQLIDIFILTLLDGHTIFLELLNQLFFYGSVSEVCTLGLYQNRSIFFVRSPLPVDTFKITFIGSKPTALRSLSKPTWHITPVVDGKMLQIQPFPFTCSILIIDREVRPVLPPFRCSGIMLV